MLTFSAIAFVFAQSIYLELFKPLTDKHTNDVWDCLMFRGKWAY